MAVEYSSTVISGIFDFFNDKDDVSVVISQTRQPDFEKGLHEYQYWASAELFKSECFDALIVISSSYLSTMNKGELEYLIQQYDTKNIVSVGLELNIKNSYCTICSPYQVYDDIVKHLKEQHGCTKIGFFSANLVQSQEGSERFDAYKKALKNNDLKFNKDYVLDGNFTMGTAKAVLNEHFKCKEDVPFDSIICANDITASAVINELSAIGVRIPMDVKVFGFDNTSHATLCIPQISTVDQQIAMQGTIAAEIAYNVMKGIPVERKTLVPLKIIYRESCGCQSFEFLMQNKNLNTHINNFADITKVDVLLDSVSGVLTMDDFVHRYKDWKDNTCFDLLIGCLYDEPISLGKKQEFFVPEKARLAFYIDLRDEIEIYYDEEIRVFPKELLFPEEY